MKIRHAAIGYVTAVLCVAGVSRPELRALAAVDRVPRRIQASGDYLSGPPARPPEEVHERLALRLFRLLLVQVVRRNDSTQSNRNV